MRVSISNIAWNPDEDDKVATLLAKHGIDAIDIAPSKYFPDFAAAQPNKIAGVRDWWLGQGIEIVGMQALLYGTEGLNLFGSEVVRERMLNHLAHVCRIAQGLKARFLVFGSPRNRDRGGLDDQSTMARAIRFFRELGDIAANFDTVICLEPNPEIYGANFMTDAETTSRVVRAVDHPAIRMQLDIGSLTINGESADVVLDTDSEIVAHIHASEPHLGILGDCGTDHEPVASAIRKYCPDRIVTIEMLEDQAAPLQGISRALSFAARCYGDTAD